MKYYLWKKIIGTFFLENELIYKLCIGYFYENILSLRGICEKPIFGDLWPQTYFLAAKGTFGLSFVMMNSRCFSILQLYTNYSEVKCLFWLDC